MPTRNETIPPDEYTDPSNWSAETCQAWLADREENFPAPAPVDSDGRLIGDPLDHASRNDWREAVRVAQAERAETRDRWAREDADTETREAAAPAHRWSHFEARVIEGDGPAATAEWSHLLDLDGEPIEGPTFNDVRARAAECLDLDDGSATPRVLIVRVDVSFADSFPRLPRSSR